MINLAQAETPLGEPVMSDDELAVFVAAFESSGFTGSINWYRNMDRNWHLLADVDPVVQQPTLMIYGDQDPIRKIGEPAGLRTERRRRRAWIAVTGSSKRSQRRQLERS